MLAGMWRTDELAEAAAAGLRGFDRAARIAQEVRGVDALSEVDLHPVLREGLEGAGFGVYPEQPYPTPPSRRALRRERERCDLVLTPDPSLRVRDVVEELAVLDAAGETLFSVVAKEELAAAPGIGADEAYWLEVKAVGQHCYTEDVPGPNRGYAGELMAAAADLVKLSRDPRIVHGGLLLVLFTEDEATSRHDLGVFVHRCLDKDLAIETPTTVRAPIDDRIGNRVCTVALVPVRPSAHEVGFESGLLI